MQKRWQVPVFYVMNPICWGLPLGMNLSLYLAMLIIVHTETIGYNGVGHWRSLETQALSRRQVEPGPVEGGGILPWRSLVPALGMEALRRALDLQDRFSLVL